MKKTIGLIADRAVEMFGCDKLTIIMDLHYCIEGGCNLDLDKLLNADNFNFSHDIAGIHNNLDRETYQLNNFFLPRCCK